MPSLFWALPTSISSCPARTNDRTLALWSAVPTGRSPGMSASRGVAYSSSVCSYAEIRSIPSVGLRFNHDGPCPQYSSKVQQRGHSSAVRTAAHCSSHVLNALWRQARWWFGTKSRRDRAVVAFAVALTCLDLPCCRMPCVESRRAILGPPKPT